MLVSVFVVIRNVSVCRNVASQRHKEEQSSSAASNHPRLSVCVHSAFSPFFVFWTWHCSVRCSGRNTEWGKPSIHWWSQVFLMGGALQLAICCCKPEYELSICIMLMERSDFALLFCAEIVPAGELCVCVCVCVSLWSCLTVHTVQPESVCILILCSQRSSVQRPGMYACVYSQLV